MCCSNLVESEQHTATGTEQTTLTGHTCHTNFVMSVAFSPDGTLIASASGDHTVRLWDTATTDLLLAVDTGLRLSSIDWRGGRLAVGADIHVLRFTVQSRIVT